jgi:hypothetical protein
MRYKAPERPYNCPAYLTEDEVDLIKERWR